MQDDERSEYHGQAGHVHVAAMAGYFHGRAAASTVEALVFGLRERGTAALKEPPVQRRVGELSEAQLHEVCGRLQKLKTHIAKSWSADKIKALVETWQELHHG
jgi:hypothetical protein